MDENSRVIRTLFMKPEMFGVGIVHPRRFVHQETCRGARWLAETPIREEFEWVLARLRETNSLSRGLPRSRGSPLLPAADWGQLLLVILFLHFGADPNEQDGFGNKALFVANERPESENVIQSLMKYGCKLNHQTYEDLTLFSNANSKIRKPSTGKLKLLFKESCDTDVKDTAGPPALMKATVRGASEIVGLQLNGGWDMNV